VGGAIELIALKHGYERHAKNACGEAGKKPKWPSRTGLDRQTKACWRSPGSRACCFSACAGSQTTQDRTATRDERGCRIATRGETAVYVDLIRDYDPDVVVDSASAEGCPPLFSWFTGTTAQSDFSGTYMSVVRLVAFLLLGMESAP
jgi:hypothetical protein